MVIPRNTDTKRFCVSDSSKLNCKNSFDLIKNAIAENPATTCIADSQNPELK